MMTQLYALALQRKIQFGAKIGISDFSIAFAYIGKMLFLIPSRFVIPTELQIVNRKN